MALSKRLRYEILRRDNHACRYCGATAPDVALTVDHVVPVALGGTNEPGNLVTACQPCNAGKSASSPDAAVIEDVSNDALRWAAAMQQAADEQRSQMAERARIFERIEAIWRPRRLPTGWESSVDAFLSAGLHPDIIAEMAYVAVGARGVDYRWGYFCGCCWKRVKQLQDRAADILNEQERQGR